MIIAVIIGGMLMPAQVFAKNDRNDRGNRENTNKVQMDYNRSKHSNGKVVKLNKKKPAPVVHHKPAPVVHHKPAPVVHHHKPAPVVHYHCKPAPVVHHHCKPAPVVHHHCHPAPVVHHHHCGNGVAEAVTAVVGLAGLISILAN